MNILKKYINLIIEQTNKTKNFEYVAGKGIRLYRYGGLGGTKQKNTASPSGVKNGMWAFIWPHFDDWFLSGQMSKIGGRFTKDGEKSMKINDFWYDGPIFFRLPLDLDPHIKEWDETWSVTHTRYLPKILTQLYSSDLDFAKSPSMYYGWNDPKGRTEKFLKHINNIKDPYLQGRISKDHYEVFIPKHPNELMYLFPEIKN